MYLISCPLITIPGKKGKIKLEFVLQFLNFFFSLGLFYFVLRHFVDSYNTLFSHPPSRANRDIFQIAIRLIIFSFLLLQIPVFYFLKLHYGIDHPTTIFAVVLLGISIPLPFFIELKREIRRCVRFIRHHCRSTRPYTLPVWCACLFANIFSLIDRYIDVCLSQLTVFVLSKQRINYECDVHIKITMFDPDYYMDLIILIYSRN